MAVKITTSLIELIKSDLGEPHGVGHRPFWQCPFHEDRDPSLTITPDESHWKCFGCGRFGDAIDWARERRGISFQEAISYLTGQEKVFSSTRHQSRHPAPIPKCSPEPTADWIRRASCVVEHYAKLLQSPQGAKARLWLHNRGLKLETITRWQIGYCPEDGFLHGLKVHRGITIPWIEEGHVRAIKIRRPNLKPKYVCVKGSYCRGFFLSQAVQPGFPALVVEGEFDALLGWQEARHLVNVVTLGSAAAYPDRLALQQLLTSPVILLCYDNDQAGRTAVHHLQGLSERIRSCRFPQGKDLTEFFLKGGDIRGWVEAQLHQNGPYATRHLTVGDNRLHNSELPVGCATRHHPTLQGAKDGTCLFMDIKEVVVC